MRGLFRTMLSLFGGGGRPGPAPAEAPADAPPRAAFRVPGMT